MRDYISFGKKLIYIILFGGLVWFISFSIFPENQVIKISVGEESPKTFLAPKYIEIIDEDTLRWKSDDGGFVKVFNYTFIPIE